MERPKRRESTGPKRYPIFSIPIFSSKCLVAANYAVFCSMLVSIAGSLAVCYPFIFPGIMA